jgi:WD40 repeat protein
MPRRLRLVAVCIATVVFFYIAVKLLSPTSIILSGHTDWIGTIALGPDGRLLASASSDHSVKLWDGIQGKERITLAQPDEEIASLAFSPDGRTLAAAIPGKTLRFWDVSTGLEQLAIQGDFCKYTSLAFSPDGNTLATVGHSETAVRLWDVSSGKLMNSLAGHTGGITSIAFSPQGDVIASGSWDGTVRLWDKVAGQGRRILRANPKAYINSVAFSPDGKTLACGNADVKEELSAVALWDVESGQERKRLSIGHCQDETYIYYVTFSPDGKTLVAIENESAIHLWDVASGEKLASLGPSNDDQGRLDGMVDTICERLAIHRWHESVSWQGVFFKPDGKVTAYGRNNSYHSGRWDYTVILSDVATIPKARR